MLKVDVLTGSGLLFHFSTKGLWWVQHRFQYEPSVPGEGGREDAMTRTWWVRVVLDPPSAQVRRWWSSFCLSSRSSPPEESRDPRVCPPVESYLGSGWKGVPVTGRRGVAEVCDGGGRT